MDWNYHERGGATDWGRLTLPGTNDLAFPDCSGKRQSPIDVPASAPVSPALTLEYRPTKLSITSPGPALLLNCQPGSSLTLANKRYALQQFHFHAPGEHRVDGSYGALEAHFVHQADDGELAVIGVLMEPGAPNSAFEAVLGVIDAAGDKQREALVDPRELMPADLSHYAYDGSLTTPPCSEGVRWHVVRQRITASREQIERFRALPFLNPDGTFAGNARPVQPLNGRFES